MFSRDGRLTPRVVVSWSTGKDSAWCLHRLRTDEEAQVVGLLTTVTPVFGRVSVHGTRTGVLDEQARRLGLSVWKVELPHPCSNEAYESAMGEAVRGLREEWGATHVAFGDLFLEDIRAYREERLEGSGIEPLFPLWGLDTATLAAEMLDAGVRAVIVSAPETSPAADLVGRVWSKEALAALPADVDPCGERGEFHTCVVGAPGLEAIEHRVGEIVRREEAVYADLALAPPSRSGPA